MRAAPLGRAGADEIAAAERSAAARLAADDEREWAERIAAAKERAAIKPRGTTSIWQPGDEGRRRDVVSLRSERQGPIPEQPDKLREAKRQDDLRRERERWEARRPIPAPPGYDEIEEFPGIKTYISQRTGRRYTEMDVRRGTLDPSGIPELGGPPKASVVRPRLLTRIGGGLRALGRRLIGR
jgi:hypothetical protein